MARSNNWASFHLPANRNGRSASIDEWAGPQIVFDKNRIGRFGARPLGGSGRRDAEAAPVARGAYDFDTPYSRIGWDDDKWDGAIRTEHVDHLVAGMSISDMDFKCAPAITAALKRRVAHENWGEDRHEHAGPMAFKKGIIDWNGSVSASTYQLDNLEITTGVHPGLRRHPRLHQAGRKRYCWRRRSITASTATSAMPRR